MTTGKAGAAGLTAERVSEREFVVTRVVDGPVALVFRAWTTPELFRRWWLPQGFGLTLISFTADIRTGGTYRLETGHPGSDQPMAFFGRYLEVTPPSRVVWTNDEAGPEGAVTTVTFEAVGAATRVVVHELYPTAAALDAALADGSTTGWPGQFDQLEALVAELAASR